MPLIRRDLSATSPPIDGKAVREFPLAAGAIGPRSEIPREKSWILRQ
jgi:hypothetical protein